MQHSLFGFGTISSGINPPNIGTTMSPVTVLLTDANNNLLSNVSGTMVTVSCTSSCPITGTTTTLLQNGQATFSGILFNGPARGITLQFSATGATTATSSTFDVGESTSGARQ